MPGLNFFRLYPKQKKNLLSLLKQKGLKQIDTKSVQHESTKYNLSLFFSMNPKKDDVKWIKDLQMVFAVPSKKVRNYSAVVLIRGPSLFYAVTYGIAHFFVSRFADIDFGIDIAARIVDDYKIKSSRAFGGKLTKSIQSYNGSFEVPFDAGESVNYIKGSPFNKASWGKTISCGQSVQLRKRDFSPSCAHILASRLENTLNDKILKQIPRSAKIVDKAKIDELMNSLIRDMQQGNYMVSVSPQQLSGVEFVFSDIYTYYLQHDSGALELEENLSIETVQTIVKKHFKSDYVKFLNSVVEARKDEEYSFEKKMLCFIDSTLSEISILIHCRSCRFRF